MQVEGSTILAILLGTVAGGFLAAQSDLPAILVCLLIYLLSLGMTFLVPARSDNPDIRYRQAAGQFFGDAYKLFRGRRSRFSLIGTGAFWLTASVLRIALIAWLPINLGIEDTANFTNQLWPTVTLLFITGVMGGIFLIPLNTMLHEEGKTAIGSGRTIAVQNFVENSLTD